MHTKYIIAGFTDLKSEFRKISGTTKSVQDLTLWFSFESNILYMHDYENHKISVALAVFDQGMMSWRNLLSTHNYGSQVVEFAINIYPQNELASRLFSLYQSHGFFPLGST